VNASLGDNALQRLKRIVADKHELTTEDLRAVAAESHQPEAAVLGVATYYSDLGLERRGATQVKVCRGTACFAAAGNEPHKWLEAALGAPLDGPSPDGRVSLETVYCLGLCHCGPAIEVDGLAEGGLTEARVDALAKEIAKGVEKGAENAQPAKAKGPENAPANANASARANANALATEPLESLVRRAHAPVPRPHCEAWGGPAIILERLASRIDATNLEEARRHHVFAGLRRALTELTPEAVLQQVEVSGLRGRGGAGFPTASKWRFAAANIRRLSDPAEAYVVCNGDEGDPGSYIDLELMERDPFAVIEGVTLAGYAIDATKGVIYVRSEYPRSIEALSLAVKKARVAGLLGENILGSRFSYDIEVVGGAGSYVCGEETALLRSLEGLRGMVTARPPFPAERGLFGKPTVVNNVETLANLGWIIRSGGEAYAALGVGKSRGTKTLSLNERFVRPGIYEVPLGTPLRTVLERLGGGMKTQRPIKVVQVGGPLGGILPEKLLDTRLGFEELDAVGALLGHGGVVAWDDSVDVRDIAEHLFAFCDAESCGKCVPCRVGGRRGLELVRRLRTRTEASEAASDVELLTSLCETMKYGSLCAHGGGLPAPIASLLLHFSEEMTRLSRGTTSARDGARP
jgi:formate dehydrogenase iron-sulfur subunit